MNQDWIEAAPETVEQIRGMGVFEVSERYLSGDWPDNIEEELLESSKSDLERWADRGYENTTGILSKMLQPYDFERQKKKLVENRGRAPHNYSVWSEFWEDIEEGIPEKFSGRRHVKEGFRAVKELEWLSEEFGKELDIDQRDQKTVYEIDLGNWGLGARTENESLVDSEPRYAFFRFDDLDYHSALSMISRALDMGTEEDTGLASQLPLETGGGKRVVFDTYMNSPSTERIFGNHMVIDKEGQVREIDADFSSDHSLETAGETPTVYITDSNHIRSQAVYEHFYNRNHV